MIQSEMQIKQSASRHLIAPLRNAAQCSAGYVLGPLLVWMVMASLEPAWISAQENMIQASVRRPVVSGDRSRPDFQLEKLRDLSRDPIWSTERKLETEPNRRSQLDQQDRIRSIQDQIKLLEKIMNEKQQLSKAQSISPLESTNSNPQQPANQLRNQTILDDEPVPEGLKNSDVEANEIESISLGFPEELSHPIDSRELANSLFLSGNWQAALVKYEFYLTHEPSQFEQDAWAQYALANCYRLAGELSKAESYYRDVVSTQTKNYPGMMAGWYLGYLSQLKDAKSEFEQIDAEAVQLLDTLGDRNE